MRSSLLLKSLVGLVISCAGLTPLSAQTSTQVNSCSAISLGPLGALNGFVPSSNDAWHQDISAAPLDPNSTKIITTSGDLANRYLHPDFSSVAGGAYGIPYTVVDSSVIGFTPFVNFNYPDESDVANYPIPADLPIEGNPGDCPTDGSDRHAIIIDRNSCVIYELYQAGSCKISTPAWSASNAAMWDMLSVEKRPYGATSTDAAGLSVFEGLVRYDEVAAGQINHAIRFTANHTKNDANDGYFVAPATHAAGTLWGTDNIMGMRIRLKANFDISGFSPTNQIILKAMKQYGMILADNGSDMFFQGTPDARWDDDDLSHLKSVPSSAFEVVNMESVYDSATAPTGAPPVISSFTASSSTITPGQSVNLTSVSDGSYSYIDQVGFTRGIVSVSPTQTTTYTLTSRNAYGTSTATTTVTVQATASAGLSFVPIPDKTIGAMPFTVWASSASTGAITYSVVGGPATISGNLVTLIGIGTVTLQASQAAAGSYAAATATVSFNVVSATSTLQFAPISNQTFGAAPFPVSASSQSSGVVTYSIVSGPATIAGNVVSVNGVGTVTVQAVQAAAGSYPSASATISFQVTPATPTLTFNAIADQTYGAAPFAVTASSASTGAVAYAVVSGPATVAANVVTVTGTGTVSLQASQAPTTNYTAATANASFQVKSTAAALQFAPIPDQTYGAPSFTVSATSLSAGAITYTILSGPATVSANVVTTSGVGTVLVQASQAAAGNYSATTITTNFQVLPVAPALTISTIGTKIFGVAPFAPSAASPSQGPISWTVSGPATLSGNLITLQGGGVVTVSATQAASGNYSAATASTSFTVQDFQISIPQSITVQDGTPASTNVLLSGQQGFAGTVNVTCSLPAAMTMATCTAGNVQLSSTSTQADAEITITTAKAFTQASNGDSPNSHGRALFFALLAPLGLLLRRRRLVQIAIVLLGFGLVGMSGCGTGIAPSTAAGTYNATITAVSGTASHSTTISIVVQ